MDSLSCLLNHLNSIIYASVRSAKADGALDCLPGTGSWTDTKWRLALLNWIENFHLAVVRGNHQA